MQKTYKSIADFIGVREKCFFCDTTLQPLLTNYFGLRKTGIPILQSPIEGNFIKFDLTHTTQSYSIESTGIIDIQNNLLTFDVRNAGHNTPALYLNATPTLDQFVAQQAFDDMKPHIEVSCPSKLCKMGYHISSYPFIIDRAQDDYNCSIAPLKWFTEGFKTKTLIIRNDNISNITCIYSRARPHLEPIKVPMLDFQAMGKVKLLTRIGTLVTFS